MSCSSVKMGSNRCTAMASSSTILLHGMILRLSEKAICNGTRRGFRFMAYEDSLKTVFQQNDKYEHTLWYFSAIDRKSCLRR